MNGVPDLSQADGIQRGVFVGREAELREIDAVLEGLSAGRAADGFVVVGRPGAGRTALLGQVGSRARLAGWVIAEADCGTGGNVTRTVVEAVTTAARELARRRPGATAVRELNRLCDDAGAAADPAAAALRRLCLVLGEAADESRCGVVITIDDAPTDEATALVLDACSGPSRRALPVLTLAAQLPGADPDESLERLDLGPLSVEELAELLTARLVAADPARLLAASGGWPGFAVPLLARDPSGWPISIGELVAEQLGALRPAERRYLETVAELGPGAVDTVVIARALGDSTRFSPESSTLAAVRQTLLDARLLYQPTAKTVDLVVESAADLLRRR